MERSEHKFIGRILPHTNYLKNRKLRMKDR